VNRHPVVIKIPQPGKRDIHRHALRDGAGAELGGGIPARWTVIRCDGEAAHAARDDEGRHVGGAHGGGEIASGGTFGIKQCERQGGLQALADDQMAAAGGMAPTAQAHRLAVQPPQRTALDQARPGVEKEARDAGEASHIITRRRQQRRAMVVFIEPGAGMEPQGRAPVGPHDPTGF